MISAPMGVQLMSTTTIIIIGITAGIHVIGLGLLLLWMAAGFPMSKDKLKLWLDEQHLPFVKRLFGSRDVVIVERKLEVPD